MPIYEYQCQHCKHQFEAIRKISDEPLTVCPSCGRATLKKLISKAAFRLKGGGWYETDFKSKGKKNVAGERSEGDSKSESGGDKKDGAKKSSSESSSGGESSAKSSEKTEKKAGDGAKSSSKGSKAKSSE